MKQHLLLSIFLALAVALDWSSTINAASRSRRQGLISQALQTPEPATTGTPVKVANLDRISTHFENKKAFEDVNDLEIKQPPVEPYPNETQRAELAAATAAAAQEFKKDEKARAALQAVEKKEMENEVLEMSFQDAELTELVSVIAEFFDITFVSYDILDPLPKGPKDDPARSLKGNKITFKTNKPLSPQEAWNLFVTFLDIAGFSVRKDETNPGMWRIETIKSAQRAAVPTYIGITPALLPDNDEMIRYLYFLENASIQALDPVIRSLVSPSAGSPIFLKEHKAFILVDKSYNIKSLMQIVKELDKGTLPEVMSVLKLKQVDAEDVRKLYEELTQTGGDKSSPFQWGARKQPTAIYFPENARIIAEPRTNSLILLGPRDAIQKIEDFIVKYIDVDLDQPYSPLFPIQLQYADAKVVADIMNTTTKFGQATEAGKSGGVRGRDKYLRQMSFTPEPVTNQVIVRGDYEDYLVAKGIIQKLDEPQPQVALDVLVVAIDLIDAKGLGAQIRSKVTQAIPALAGLLGKNVVFQTSGLDVGNGPQGIETNSTGPGFTRLLGNLINLVTQAPAGNTIITFGQDLYGVWGLFQILRNITNTQVLSNPFLIVSNKSPARVQVGETRRVVSQTTITNTAAPVQGLDNDTAALQVDITPQINSDGMILLNLQVNLTQFTDATNPTSGDKDSNIVKTQAIVADREVLALGGLLRDKTGSTISKVPVLGDIPFFGRLFKNQSKTQERTSLLVLVSAKIIPPYSSTEVNQFTQDHMKTFQLGLEAGISDADKRDPIHKIFFAQGNDEADISETLLKRHGKELPKKAKRRGNRKKQPPIAAGLIEQLDENIHLTQQQPAVQPVAPMVQPTIIAEPSRKQDMLLQTALAENGSPKAPVLTHKKKRGSRSLNSFLSPAEPEERQL